MFGGIAWLVSGNMACGILGEDLIVRLEPDEAAQALREEHTRQFDFTGRPAKGMVVVESAAIAEADLAGWVEAGVGFASSLPPEVARSPPGRTMRVWRTGWAGGRGWRERWRPEPCSYPRAAGATTGTIPLRAGTAPAPAPAPAARQDQMSVDSNTVITLLLSCTSERYSSIRQSPGYCVTNPIAFTCSVDTKAPPALS